MLWLQSLQQVEFMDISKLVSEINEFVIQPLVAFILCCKTHSFIKGSIPSLIAGLAFGALLGE